MKNVLLRSKQLCKSFEQGGKSIPVLDHISMEIFEGDFTVIMGTSGAGKSTLLYALSGMDSITSGTVEFEGNKISGLSEKKMAELRAVKFGFVFQQSHLVSNLTLLENVAVAGCVGKTMLPNEVMSRAEQLFNQMGVKDAKDRLPAQTSGGEMQRAAIARAVISNPKIIFADEPTGALNKAGSKEVLDLLSGLHENGQSILMVTHDVRAALRGNRLLYLEDGRILDELKLPAYEEKKLPERESAVNEWLSSLRW